MITVITNAEFEYIHPFQDGNGRVGRLIALKECLRHNVIPFIIEDSKKNFYYRGLKEWRNEKKAGLQIHALMARILL